MSSANTWKSLPEPNASIGPAIVSWYQAYGRQFPWRETRHSFQILCTEIMLQRTRARQVASVFSEHVASWRGPDDVLELGKEGVKRLFGRLGLVWRAQYFWALQLELKEHRHGEVPEDRDELLSLPGVGWYVATATRVYAFGRRETAVDSNVLRIFGRLYGLTFPDHARRSPRVVRWASAHCPDEGDQTRAFNWGLVDIGSILCTPDDPDHEACPLQASCRLADRNAASCSEG